MATPPPTAAEQHQLGQAALVSLVPAAVAQAWQLLDPHDLAGTTDALSAAVQAIVNRYGQASAAAALQFYRQQRLLAGVKGRTPSLTVPPAPSADVVARNVSWSVSSLYGPVTPASVQDAQANVTESAARLVLDQGRDAVIAATVKDPAAKGWVRVTEPGACAFCTMLALRGVSGLLYKSKGSAGTRMNAKFTGGAGEFNAFKAHDNCRCHVEPVFTAYEPSYRLREAQDLWKSSTKGKGGKDALNAFRTALANRPQDA